MLSFYNSCLDFTFRIIQFLEFMGEDDFVILKIAKEILKRIRRVLEPLHLIFRLLFFPQVVKWIVNANKGNLV